MNWKTTFMIEYDDVEERKQALAKNDRHRARSVVQVEGFDKVNPIANEDLERATEDKTSSVHFVRSS